MKKILAKNVVANLLDEMLGKKSFHLVNKEFFPSGQQKVPES